MNTQSLKISLLTFFTAMSVLEASSLHPDDDIINKVARPTTTRSLAVEKSATIPQYISDRTDMILALNSAIGPEFETALRQVLGNTAPTDGLTQKQITEILRQVTRNKNEKALELRRAEAAGKMVRATLAPVVNSVNNLTINNNFLIQNFVPGHGHLPGTPFGAIWQRHTLQAYPGGMPNPQLLNQENSSWKEKGNKRLSWGELVLRLPESE